MALLGSGGGYTPVTSFRSVTEQEDERKRVFAKTWQADISEQLQSFRRVAGAQVQEALKLVEQRRTDFGRSQLAVARDDALQRFGQVEHVAEERRKFREAAQETIRNLPGWAQEEARRKTATLTGGLETVPELRDAPQWARDELLLEAGQKPQAALQSIVPESAWRRVEGIPVVGEEVERVGRGMTSPVGIAATGLSAGLMPGLTAAGVAGTALGGLAGQGLEEAGVPVVQTPIGGIGPRSVGEAIGGLATPAMFTKPGQLFRQAAVRSLEKRGLPGALLTEEAGGTRLPGGAIPTGIPQGPAGPPPLASVATSAAGGPPIDVPFPRPSTLASVQDIAADVYNSTRNAMGALTRAAGKAPPIRGIAHAVNPSAFAGDPPASWVTAIGPDNATNLQTALIAHQRKLDMGSSIVSAAESAINQRARSVGLTLKDGLLANKNGVLGPLGDVAENPGRYALSAQQREFFDQVDELLKQQHAAEIASGVKKGEIFSEEGRYFPRQVVAVEGVPKAGGPVRANTGARQSFQQGRLYETMAEGTANGVDYANDIGAVIGARLRAGVKAASDTEFADIVRPLGRTGKPTARVGEMSTTIPAFGDRVFSRDVAKALMDELQPPMTRGPVGVINSGNALLRALRATGDLSYSFIQNLVGAATNPAAALKSVATGLDSLILDGRLYGQWVQTNARQVERFVNAGGLMGGSEFTFENILSNRSIPGLLKRGTSRFDNAFNNASNVNALTHFEGMAGIDAAMGPSWFRKAARVAFGDFMAFKPSATSDEIAASAANKLAGRISSRALGVGAMQREVESLFAFAPRFYRATFGLLGDAVQGGMRGAEARRTLALFATGATAAYIGAARSLGQEPRLDPSRSDFFTVTIGSQAVGFGGPMMGLVRMLAVAGNDPSRLGDMSIRTNPLLKWARGRTAPILGIAIDLISQKTYIGQEVRTPEQIGKYVATQGLPFTGQGLVQEGPQAAAAQFTGLRSFPEPAFNPAVQIWDMEEYPGLTAGQAIDIHKFLGRVETYRGKQVEEHGAADSTEVIIDKLAAKEGLNEHEVNWAKALNRGAVDRSPEFIQFLVENEGSLRERYPFLYDSRDIERALFEAQAGGQ